MLPRALLLAALLPVAAFAGCISGEDPGPVAPLTNETGEDYVLPETLPDGTEFAAGKEINKTEEGAGGIDHLHDYWEGRERAEVFNRDVYLSPDGPLFPDGEGSSAKNVAYLKLPNKSLVYEGAKTVTFLAQNPRLVQESPGGVALAAPHPSPPTLSLQYRTAADAAWREPVDLTWGTPLEIEVGPREADMPHSIISLWVFRLTTSDPQPVVANVSIVAIKGADVAHWPGHPDFYAEKPYRVVMDQHVTTKMIGITEGLLYDGGATWAIPEKLISSGTDRLEVFINITKVTNAYNAQATGFFLEAHNATIIGPEILFGKRFFDVDEPEDLKHWNFTIHVMETGMDGPYQPSSRWGFRAMATFADFTIPVINYSNGLCPGCFPYEIEYDIQVVAWKDPALQKVPARWL